MGRDETVISGQWEEMEEIIKQIVKQEIRKIVQDNENSIRETVRSSLLPELRAAVRESIFHLSQDLIKETDGLLDTQQVFEGNVGTENKDNLQTEADSKKGLASPQRSRPSASRVLGKRAGLRGGREPPTSDLRPPTPHFGHRTSDVEPTTGRYLYCIVEGGEGVNLGKIGIEGNEVYTIPYEDLCAVVHNCPAEPYRSQDEEVVKKWVLTHQKVADAAWERFGTVLPMGFDTIIQGNEFLAPEQNMRNWLKEDYENLKAKMDRVRGKAEYGVQVFWNPRIMAQKLMEENHEIKELNEKIKSESKGLAYMYKQKLEDLLKKEMEKQADRYFKEFYGRIKPYVDDLRVEKTKKAEDENKQMLMNLSCLLPNEESRILGDELEKIDTLEGFSVRYTGPWPPYSFV